jgi:hypothetical protein
MANPVAADMSADAMIATRVTCTSRRCRASRSSGSAGSSIAFRIARPVHQA